MTSPTPKELSAAAGITPSYASMILNRKRPVPPMVAATMFRVFNVKFGIFEGLSDEAAEEVAANIERAA